MMSDMRDIVLSAYPMQPDLVRAARKRLGMTQAELADVLSVDVQTVANYEKGVTKISGPADAILRTIVLFDGLPPDTPIIGLKEFMRTRTLDHIPWGNLSATLHDSMVAAFEPPTSGKPKLTVIK